MTIILILYLFAIFIIELVILKKGNIFGTKVTTKVLSIADSFRWNHIMHFIKETFMPVLLYSGVNILNTSAIPMTTYDMWNTLLSYGFICCYLSFFTFSIFIAKSNSYFINPNLLMQEGG